LDEKETLLVPEAPSPCIVLYSRGTEDDAYRAVFDTTFSKVLEPGEIVPGENNCGGPVFAGVSADESSVIFESEARLTPEAEQGATTRDSETFNLYDSVAGHVYLVNVLPEGKPDVNAAFGGVSQPGEEPTKDVKAGYHHYGDAISANGSRIVWTDLNTGDLYVRENPTQPQSPVKNEKCTVPADACTVLVAAEAYYRGASENGSEILYTTKEGELFEYDVNTGKAKDLTPVAEAGVLGVIGSSEDASYVYVVAEGVLATGATEAEPNLYVLHTGEPARFIATLSPLDNTMLGSIGANSGELYGDWRAGLNTRTAEVTPDGRAVVFVSHQRLTGYDSNGLAEVFAYDAGSVGGAGSLSCASCDPTGVPPVAEAMGAFLMTPGSDVENVDKRSGASYQLRTISEDGGRVFFTSASPLVPHAASGVNEVYEWERAGEGTCTAAASTYSHSSGGCVFMISSGLASEAHGLGEEGAVFLDADATGANVFFTTRERLVPEDKNEQIDVYDARVDGYQPPTQTACSGTGCQGVPPTPPTFATPSSVTADGPGNQPPPPSTVVKPKTKTVKCAKGKHLSHGKCVKTKSKKKKTKAKKSAHTNRRAK
jgi:hypothetical protein